MRLTIKNYNSIHIKTLILILVSFLSFISWNYCGILFIGCLVLYFYFTELSKEKHFIIRYLENFLFYLILNIGITFWLYNISFKECVGIILASSLLMSCASIPYLITNNKILHIILWVIFEILNTKWDIAWPWLTYGNVMGNQWYLVQWYSYIGVYGGSIWVLIMSALFYSYWKKRKKIYLKFLIFLSLPLLFSYINYTKPESNSRKYINALSYIPRYEYNSYDKTKKIVEYIVNSDDTIDLIVTPEMFYYDMNLTDYRREKFQSLFRIISKKNPNANIIIGSDLKIDTIKFNGLVIHNNNTSYYKSKKKYVPVNEYTPPLLRPYFGESFYTKTPFDDTKIIERNLRTIPFICYESLFSDFVSINSQKADYIIVCTSETFMSSSSLGKKQYLDIVRLRAIENKKYLLKCSNDGISCLVTPSGKILQYLHEDRIEFEELKLYITKEQSFYNKLINTIVELFHYNNSDIDKHT